MAETKPVGVAYQDPTLNGAVIDNSVIGGTTAAAGTFTTMTCTTAVVGGNTLSGTELGYVDGVTPGTVTASKAVVVDSNKDAGDFRNLDAVNIDAGASGTAGTVDVFPTTASKGKIAIAAADSAGDTTTTITNASQAGARTYTVPDAGASASFVMTEGAQTINGTKTIPAIVTTNLDAGASGTAGTVDVFPSTASKGKLAITKANNTNDDTTTLTVDAHGQATTVHLPDGGAASAYIVESTAALTLAEADVLDGATAGTQVASKAVIADANVNTGVSKVTALHIGTSGSETQVTATAAELNYNDIAALGTGAASKAVVLDAGEDYTWPDTGVLTIGVLATATEAAEHGAGAIGTAATPTTKRWIERGGIIVTQTTFDLTGLASVATANDVIGLAAGGAAYIGRNVEATNGVIFKVEFSCLETPTGGDNDVNVVANSSAVLAYDGAGGTTYLSNSGDLLKGQTIQNLVPALTEGDYFYLTAGTGDTAATYTAGMYILTTYGHAALA